MTGWKDMQLKCSNGFALGALLFNILACISWTVESVPQSTKTCAPGGHGSCLAEPRYQYSTDFGRPSNLLQDKTHLQIQQTLASEGLASGRRSRSKWLLGEWKDGAQEYFSSSDTSDFMYLWEVPSGLNDDVELKTGLNITAQEALQSSGPLALLLALRLCTPASGNFESNHRSDSSLSESIARARKAGQLVVHVLGVNGMFEPMMNWDRFLVGPLTDAERRLVAAYNLPIAPFAGLRVKFVFSIYDGKVSPPQQRLRPFVPGYSEEFAYGIYHETVSETPDFAVSLNPGHAHYPLEWWPTLVRLRSRQVPIVATGYGAHMQTYFEYDKRISPQRRGKFSLELPAVQLLSKSLEPYFWSPAGVVTFDYKALHEVTGFADSTGYSIKLHKFQPTRLEEYQAPRLPEAGICEHSPADMPEVETVCSDLNGTALFAQHVGYDLQLKVRSPFKYCDDPLHGLCTGGDVVMLLESRPLSSEGHAASESPPPMLARDTLLKAAPCVVQGPHGPFGPAGLTQCLQEAVRRNVGAYASDAMDKFFAAARSECAQSSAPR